MFVTSAVLAIAITIPAQHGSGGHAAAASHNSNLAARSGSMVKNHNYMQASPYATGYHPMMNGMGYGGYGYNPMMNGMGYGGYGYNSMMNGMGYGGYGYNSMMNGMGYGGYGYNPMMNGMGYGGYGNGYGFGGYGTGYPGMGSTLVNPNAAGGMGNRKGMMGSHGGHR